FCDREITHDFEVKLSIYYLLIFTRRVMGNNLIFYIVCKLEKHDTVGNIFLLNLLMSDLVFMSSLPFWAVSHHMSSWVFGRAWCKIVGSNYFLGFYSSILFLTLMTFDRYLALHQAVHQALPEELILLACIKPFILYDQAEHYSQGLMCEEVSALEGINFKVLEMLGPYLQLGLFFIYPLIVFFFTDEDDFTRMVTYLYFCVNPGFYTFVRKKAPEPLQNSAGETCAVS
uniref:G-protein coupled receptors family 1 profile domain-containing protein n=1 Tax=Oncorhynchus tshawytscha TaxID=74940 RepID=A0AAZ3PB53_ONCTS